MVGVVFGTFLDQAVHGLAENVVRRVGDVGDYLRQNIDELVGRYFEKVLLEDEFDDVVVTILEKEGE